MSLKKLFLIVFGVQFAFVAGLIVLTILLFQNQANLNSSRDVEFHSYLLADELRQSSDDLTRLARAYVATGNPEYEREYFAILDIRNGKAPRPVEYNRIYWDFVAATGTKPRADGETIALQDLMKKEGFTDEEFAKLTEAQRNSDGLVVAETIAMNAVKGLYDDGTGNFTVIKEPDREMALNLVFDETYHKNKANIMKPIDDFYVMFQERTANEVAKFEASSTRLLYSIMGLIFGIVALFVVAFEIIRRQVTNPLQAVVQVSRQIAEEDLKKFAQEIGLIAQGDLTRSVSIHSRQLDIKSENEVGQMARALTGIIDNLQAVSASFQEMTANIRQVLLEARSNVMEVSGSSSNLALVATNAGQATQQITTTIGQVAKGTTQQAEAVNKTAAATEQMGRAIQSVARGAQEQAEAVGRASTITSQITKAIDQVSGNAQAVTRDSDAAAQAARSGAKTVEDTVKGMLAIKDKVGLSAQKVQEMGQRSDQIGAIVETIDDIASQTNLLALNAAIEAARAGEHGKGFAVVADEVRKLAERASSATKEIGGLIKGIQKTVTEAVTTMDEGAKEVENGVSYANEAGKALADILKAAEAVLMQAEQAAAAAQRMATDSNALVSAMDSVSAVVKENTSSTQAMSVNSNEVTQAIENIASVSQENSAAVEEVSASAEEMSAQVSEVTAATQSLAQMANQLLQVVSRFKLDEDGSDRVAWAAAPVKETGNGRGAAPRVFAR
ncbi:MAG: methyl-accepting chemotaxis protein [Chloroflexi bacterium]|nr:methyl-accepting chemotaxis protein [Chloroflexota bacterium]